MIIDIYQSLLGLMLWFWVKIPYCHNLMVLLTSYNRGQCKKAWYRKYHMVEESHIL